MLFYDSSHHEITNEIIQSEINSLIEDAPETPEDLIVRTRIFNCHDLFPVLSDNDLKLISTDGKIPIHAKWKDKIRNNEIAIDALLNLAGLASFTTDQAALDKRITDLIT